MRLLYVSSIDLLACLHSMLETLNQHTSMEVINFWLQGKPVGDPL